MKRKIKVRKYASGSLIPDLAGFAGGLFNPSQDTGNGITDALNDANRKQGMISSGINMASQLASNIPVIGTAIGAGLNVLNPLISGLAGKGSMDEANKLQARKNSVDYNSNLGLTSYAQEGGKISDFFNGATILGGKPHTSGGNPIVDKSGKKIAETERGELMFTKEQTTMLEQLSQSGDYNKLGEAIMKIISSSKDNR